MNRLTYVASFRKCEPYYFYLVHRMHRIDSFLPQSPFLLVQGWAKEWTLRESRLLAPSGRGGQVNAPRAHSFDQPCILSVVWLKLFKIFSAERNKRFLIGAKYALQAGQCLPLPSCRLSQAA